MFSMSLKKKDPLYEFHENHEKKHKYTALAPIFKNTSTQSNIHPRILYIFVQHVHMLLPDFIFLRMFNC